MEAPNYFAETLGRLHPLYVVRVSTILDESFTEIRKHEVLKKEGLLVEYEDSMSEPVLFCSHTWLRRSAPDNSQHVKLTLLKSVLRRAVEGSLGNLSPHWMTTLAYKEESAALHLQADDPSLDVGRGVQLQRGSKALIAGKPECEVACAGTELEHGVRRLHANSRTAGRA